jgi:hypothetical protein
LYIIIYLSERELVSSRYRVRVEEAGEHDEARIGGGGRKKQLTSNLETITSQAGKNDYATSCLSAV